MPGRKFDLPARYFGGTGLRLHHLRHEAAHGFRRLILHLAGSVGVGAEGEPRIVVAKHTGDGLDIHSILQGQRGECQVLIRNRTKSLENTHFLDSHQ